MGDAGRGHLLSGQLEKGLKAMFKYDIHAKT